MSHTEVDHLVVAAATLEQGVAWCEATFGVTPGLGGKHALMGTHKRLLKIASPVFADACLEIVVIDPAAPPPGRTRRFDLDDAALQARVAVAPQLAHLVARSTTGVVLQALTLDGVPPPAREVLRLRGVQFGDAPGPALSALLATPQGERRRHSA